MSVVTLAVTYQATSPYRTIRRGHQYCSVGAPYCQFLGYLYSWDKVKRAVYNYKQYRMIGLHSCQPLLGVNLSPEFVNLHFPYAGWLGSFVSLLVAAAFLSPTNTCGSGRKKQCCAKYACVTSNLTSNKTS